MATAKQLPSGRWRVLLYDGKNDEGKRVYKSFGGDTAVEAEASANEYVLERNRKRELRKMADALAAGEQIDKRQYSILCQALQVTMPDDLNPTLTIAEASRRYIMERKAVLSPNTVREYERIILREPVLMGMHIDEITTHIIQVWINKKAGESSPKTVRNTYGFIASVLGAYDTNISFRKIRLPQRIKPKLYTPSDDDIKKLITAIYGTNMELPVYLAAFGPLRRGEICAVDADDVSGNIVHVCKALALDSNRQWVVKPPKTTSSDRYIAFPDFVVKKFPKTGRLCPDLTPNAITKQFPKILEKSNLPHFRFHDLRAYCASISHALGIPDQYIMGRGGWNSNYVMNDAYKREISEIKKEMDKNLSHHFESAFSSEVQHEMQHKK